MKRFKKIANGMQDVVERIDGGKTFEQAFEEFCESSNMPLYFKAQVGYGVLDLLGSELDESLRVIPFLQLLKWKSRSEDIQQMVPIPSDSVMKKILSRDTTFTEPEWEKQGHVHIHDSTNLLERIYIVHEILSTNQTIQN